MLFFPHRKRSDTLFIDLNPETPERKCDKTQKLSNHIVSEVSVQLLADAARLKTRLKGRLLNSCFVLTT